MGKRVCPHCGFRFCGDPSHCPACGAYRGSKAKVSLPVVIFCITFLLVVVATCVLLLVRCNAKTNNGKTSTPIKTELPATADSPEGGKSVALETQTGTGGSTIAGSPNDTDISVTAEPQPRPAESVTAQSQFETVANGTVYLTPSFIGDCPLRVDTKGEDGYFIYLEYLGEPAESYDSHKPLQGGQGNNLAFYVAPDSSVEILVPVGIYRLYYAVGKNWYGVGRKFGKETCYAVSDELLAFYTEVETGGNHIVCQGNFLTLRAQIGDNFSSYPIAEEDFPDCSGMSQSIPPNTEPIITSEQMEA